MPLPPAFTQRMQQQLGAEFTAFEEALHTEAPVSIRVNPLKWKDTPALEPVPWASNAFYIPERPLFTLDPLLHAGAYYVQEASSMFLEQAIRQHLSTSEPVLALDLCGAPGGKSTHLSSLLPEGSLLVSNEVIKSRTNILAENTQKWGSGFTLVTQNDPREFSALPHFFDLVVVDAPCSGEGLFRRDPAAADEWSEANVKLCSERQRRILSDVWECLKPGGLLVYSTCTYSPQENEENLAWLYKEHEAENLLLHLDPQWGVKESELEGVKGYRFYPHHTRGEGFFMAIVRKPEEPVSQRQQNGKRKKPALVIAPKAQKQVVQSWLKPTHEWEIIQFTDRLAALPAFWMPELELLYSHLRIAYAGVPLAEVKKVQFNPLPSLALSAQINAGAHAIVEVDQEMAQRYLKKEDILPEGASEGWVLISHRNIPLGWIKRIKHRANNYWPKEWRIRMDLQNGHFSAFM